MSKRLIDALLVYCPAEVFSPGKHLGSQILIYFSFHRFGKVIAVSFKKFGSFDVFLLCD